MSHKKIKEEPVEEESRYDSSVLTVKMEIEIEAIEVEVDPVLIKAESDEDAATDTEQTPRRAERLVSCRTRSRAHDGATESGGGGGAERRRGQAPVRDPARPGYRRTQRHQLQRRCASDKVNTSVDNGGTSVRVGAEHDVVIKISEQYECEHCKKQFMWKSNLVTHVCTYRKKQPHTVDTEYSVCKDDTAVASNNNSNKCIFKCSVCGRTFNVNGNLKKHMRIHTGETPFECSICRKKFKQTGDLTRHLRIHTGETPYECPICDKKYKRNDELTRHLRIHTGENPYECEICGKKAIESGALRRHMRTHTGEAPFECSVCGKKCKENGALTRHMRTHTGDAPNECSVCGIKFRSKTACNKHQATHA